MKELTKRQEKLARQGNPKALDLMREYMMFYYDLFEAERAQGEAAANSKLDAYAAKYKSAAEVIAQYESPKLQATAVQHMASGDLAELLRIIDGTSRGLHVTPIEIDDTSTRH
jgi:hypothetical protein